ncbi:MAG TPA: CRISPR-associated endonuclease Cas2 [Deltaproteobacteria bacterium]|nr:CRISPR-associated endonuclease Cas2 [Deltaproteobacteria bacterium]
MIILAYDIENDALRTRFNKFIRSYGRRLQFSVYEIKNSKRILDIVQLEIKERFEKEFKQSDSVLIFQLAESAKIVRYGYAKNEEDDMVFG